MLWTEGVARCYNKIMKIDGPDKTGKTSGSKSTKKSGDSGGVFKTLLGGDKEAEETKQAGVSSKVASIDSLLAAQSTEDPTEKAARKRMQMRAGKLLDMLEDVRTGLLTGGLNLGHMVDIADVVASHREKISDPHLTQILDEIDLRAHIEITKMQVARERLNQSPR